MKTSGVLARVGLGLSGVILGSLGVMSGGPGIPEARAEPPTPGATIEPSKTCVLRGSSPIAKGTQLFDAPSGGRPIATFTGASVPMQMTQIPSDPANGRAKLATSTGSGALRLDGYVQASAIPVFTTRDAPVMAGNIWIADAQRVRLVYANPSSIGVEMTLAGSRSQSVRGATTCEGLALQKATPTSAEIPPIARTFLTKQPDTDIYDKPNGDPIFSLQMLEGSAQLFWSTETKAGFVHVKSRADLVVDGWVRWRDLDPLKRGEMMGSGVPPQTPLAEARLTFEQPPRIATAPKDIPIRAKRSESAKPIGVVEMGAQFYVMETVADFTNVLPKSLHMLPPDDGGFWIPASEVPK